MKKVTRLNNKGFTLIELLAVIVILAVVMASAATSVLSAMNNSRKASLQDSASSAADGFRSSYAEYAISSSYGLVGNTTEATNTALISGTPQALSNYATGLSITDTNYDLNNSYVYFNPTTSTFVVCMVAQTSGSYYVAGARKNTRAGIGETSAFALTADQMWACSDNDYSWK